MMISEEAKQSPASGVPGVPPTRSTATEGASGAAKGPPEPSVSSADRSTNEFVVPVVSAVLQGLFLLFGIVLAGWFATDRISSEIRRAETADAIRDFMRGALENEIPMMRAGAIHLSVYAESATVEAISEITKTAETRNQTATARAFLVAIEQLRIQAGSDEVERAAVAVLNNIDQLHTGTGSLRAALLSKQMVRAGSPQYQASLSAWVCQRSSRTHHYDQSGHNAAGGGHVGV